MPSELRRGFIRILSNYTRLLITVVFGLLIVRLVLQAAGTEGWGLVALFGSTIGFASMFEEIVRASMIRELGEAHHSGDDARFRRTFNSALIVSAAAAGLALFIFFILYIIAPVFNVGDMLIGARHLIAAKALYAAASIAVGPLFNMYLVTERMVAYNFWMVMTQRLGDFVAAVCIVLMTGLEDPEQAIIAFAWISAAIAISSTILRAVMIIIIDRRLVPRLHLASRAAMRQILHVGGWNASVVTAMNLHLRLDAIIVNLFFGLFANAVFGLAVQLTSYTRRLSVGVTDGLDAVSARLSAGPRVNAVADLARHSTRLHGLVTFPALFAVVLLAEPLLRVWLGEQIVRRFDEPDMVIRQAAVLTQVLSLGIGVRSLTDGWMRILYGAGHIRRYAPWILFGGLLNPLLAILLIWMLPGGVPELAAPAVAFAALMFAVHGIGLAKIASTVFEIPVRMVLAPLLRPLVVAAACSPILIAAESMIAQWSAWELLLTLLTYACSIVVCTLIFGVNREERARILNALRKRRPSSIDRDRAMTEDVLRPPRPADSISASK